MQISDCRIIANPAMAGRIFTIKIMSEINQGRIILDFEELEKEAERPDKYRPDDLTWGERCPEEMKYHSGNCSCPNKDCTGDREDMFKTIRESVLFFGKIPDFLKGMAPSRVEGFCTAFCECPNCPKELFWFHIPNVLAGRIAEIRKNQE